MSLLSQTSPPGDSTASSGSEPRAGAPGPKEIRDLQDQALASLPLGNLYITLFIRDDPPQFSDFHWSIYHHNPPTGRRGGIKHHIRGWTSRWMADHERVGNVFKSNFLCVVMEIGTIPGAVEAQFEQVVRSLDNELNDQSKHPDMTCRTWIFKIMRKLVDAGLINCTDIQALEEECLQAANSYMQAAADNKQPRPVVKATTSK